MTHVLSENAKLFYNAGTFGAPSWTEITNVKDVTLTLEKDEIDVTTRGSGGYKEFVDGLIDATIDFNMIWDTTDAAFTAIRTAFFAKSAVEFLVLDDGTTDGQGLRATCMIKSFSRGETLGEALTVDVSIRPVKNSNSPPTWYGS